MSDDTPGGRTLDSETVRDLLGPVPSRPAGDAETVASERCDGFVRRTLEYPVAGGERVQSFLLLPDGDGRQGAVPGVLAVHGHGGQYHLGKYGPGYEETDANYDYGVELARRGCAVLCPDLLGFGDRRPAEFERREGLSPRPGPEAGTDADYERFVATARLVDGETLLGTYLSDLGAALDVLGAAPPVDADRLAAVGFSLGGWLTLWLAWHDHRVDAAVCASGAATYRGMADHRITHSPSFYVPGLREAGDVDAALRGVAPTPLLLTAGEADETFPVGDVRRVHETLAGAYRAADAADCLGLRTFDGGHAFPPAVRREAYHWLETWLR